MKINELREYNSIEKAVQDENKDKTLPISERAYWQRAITYLKAGKPIIIVDDDKRENEGDIVIAGQFATPERINFMIKEGRGIVCTPIRKERAQTLHIPLMVQHNTDNHQTAFTVSIDHIQTSTGVSAYDRSQTILSLLDQKTKAEDLRRPGHVFPLIYHEGGVLVREGHTEASIDICRIAGLEEVAVICEITNDDGTMARQQDIQSFAQKFNLPIVSVQDIIAYRKQTENFISLAAKSYMPTKYGDFMLYIFHNTLDHKEHMAIVKGKVEEEENVLVRVHSECLTGDVLGSKRCDCGDQLAYALETIEKRGKGVVLYMRQEGRGIGLTNKIKAYALQEKGYDTVEANCMLGFPPDMREYVISAQILQFLKIQSIELLTNNPKKKGELAAYGISVKKRLPIIMKTNKYNDAYLATKVKKMGHLMNR